MDSSSTRSSVSLPAAAASCLLTNGSSLWLVGCGRSGRPCLSRIRWGSRSVFSVLILCSGALSRRISDCASVPMVIVSCQVSSRAVRSKVVLFWARERGRSRRERHGICTRADTLERRGQILGVLQVPRSPQLRGMVLISIYPRGSSSFTELCPAPFYSMQPEHQQLSWCLAW